MKMYSRKVDVAIISMMVLSLMILVWEGLSRMIYGSVRQFDGMMLWVFYPVIYIATDKMMGWNWKEILWSIVDRFVGFLLDTCIFIVEMSYSTVGWFKSVDWKKVFTDFVRCVNNICKTVRTFIYRVCTFVYGVSVSCYEWIKFVVEVYEVKDRTIRLYNNGIDCLDRFIDNFYDGLNNISCKRREVTHRYSQRLKVRSIKIWNSIVIAVGLNYIAVSNRVNELRHKVLSVVYVGSVKE